MRMGMHMRKTPLFFAFQFGCRKPLPQNTTFVLALTMRQAYVCVKRPICSLSYQGRGNLSHQNATFLLGLTMRNAYMPMRKTPFLFAFLLGSWKPWPPKRHFLVSLNYKRNAYAFA